MMEPSMEECLLSRTRSRRTFEIVSPVLDPSKEDEWLISDGEQTIGVTIEDEEFLEAVRSGEISFAAGSSIVADLEVTHRIVNGGVKSKYRLTQVVELRNT